MGDQPHQSIEEDHNDDDDEVEEDIHQQEAQQHLIIEEDDENYNSDLSDEEADYSHEDEYDEEEYEEEEGEGEGEDEEEEELMNEDLENGVETASCSSKENEGGWNRSEIDGLFCPICMEAWSNGGDHQVW